MEKLKGIDVSAWQGEIDWDAVKATGIQFAILRCGYGMDLKEQDDKWFERNASECERVGIPYGVYLYSYANTVEKAASEAAHVLRLVNGHKPTYPIYYDLEDDDTTGKCSNDLILQIAKKFVDTLEEAGYWVGIYANLYWHNTHLTNSWYDTKARWVAQYNSECNYHGDYGIWQYSSSGTINGIAGYVDMDWAYIDYPAKIEQLVSSGTVYVVQPGDTLSGIASKYNTTYQTLASYNGISNPNIIQIGQEIHIPKRKSLEQLALEVYRGEWGNGAERVRKLTIAGYDYDTVQEKVNELYG